MYIMGVEENPIEQGNMKKKTDKRTKTPKHYVAVAVNDNDPTDVLALCPNNSKFGHYRWIWSKERVYLFNNHGSDYLLNGNEFLHWHTPVTKEVEEEINDDCDIRKRKDYLERNGQKNCFEKDPVYKALKKAFKKKCRNRLIGRTCKAVHMHNFARTTVEYEWHIVTRLIRTWGAKISKHGYTVRAYRLNSKLCPINVSMEDQLKWFDKNKADTTNERYKIKNPRFTVRQ